MTKVHIPAGEPAGRIVCPQCGNLEQFIEVADNVLLTTHYLQNHDGSFTTEKSSTEVLGELRFLCDQCGEDLSHFHSHFREMSF